MSSAHFCASSYHFGEIKFTKKLPSNVGQGHGVQFSQLHQPMVNANIYKRTSLFFKFLIFAKVRYAYNTQTDNAHTHTHTHTHRNGQAHGYRRILQICSKTRSLHPSSRYGALFCTPDVSTRGRSAKRWIVSIASVLRITVFFSFPPLRPPTSYVDCALPSTRVSSRR